MREQCSCGASIQGRRRDVLHWRGNHRHDIAEDQKEGAFSQNEHAGHRGFEYTGDEDAHDFPIVYARMGFAPNPPAR